MAAAMPEFEPETHEFARVSDPYRALAAACIADAIKCLDFAEAYRRRLPFAADPDSRLHKYEAWKHVLQIARTHWRQIENDLDWFRASDGYSLWVCATALTDDEAEAVRDEYLRRAEPLLDEYDEALLRWGRGYVPREKSEPD